jgi:RNA polymerase sigma-70 factor (ECF subfamily)
MLAPREDDLSKLLEPVHVPAFRFCRRLCTTREEAEDLYHDCIVAAWRGLPKLKDRSRFGPWFFQIIINTFRNRTRRSPLSGVKRLFGWESDDEHAQDAVHVSVDPRGQLEARRQIDKAMRALSADERSLVVLFELEGHSVAELARIWECPEGTIKSRLARARAKMREAILHHQALPHPQGGTANTREVDYGLHANPQTTE